MKELVAFLDELAVNNHKEWFDDNRARYQRLRDEFIDFTEKMIAGISGFDPTVANQRAKDCIFRINRDTRFSKNKEPYKTHFGAHITRGGRVSGYGGYYFHVEAHGLGAQQYIGGHILAAGIHMPTPKELESIRTEIFDNPEGYLKAVATAKNFTMDTNERLVRMPKGFPEDFKHAELLKYKQYSPVQFITDERLFASGLLDFVLAEFATVAPLNAFLNRAIDYART